MLHRYGNIDYVLTSPLKIGLSILSEANKKEIESLMWQMWLAILPTMDKKSFISFDDYKKRLTQSKPKEQTVDEQISMTKLLNAAYGGEVVETHDL